MAEGFFRDRMKDRGDWEALSAGLAAPDGQPPSAHGVTAMAELGLDISAQRSLQVTAALVDEVDYIFGLTFGHVDGLARCFPQAREKIFLLREFVEELPPTERDIADPIGGDLAVYTACRDQIQQGIDSVIQFIEQQTMSPSQAATTIAIGADHGGFELKQALVAHLEGLDLTVQDYGPTSAESCDYPDFAQAVARSVASGQHAVGILICKT